MLALARVDNDLLNLGELAMRAKAMQRFDLPLPATAPEPVVRQSLVPIAAPQPVQAALSGI
jgi:hypothetical protein